MFDEGNAVIKDDAKPVLDGIADILASHESSTDSRTGSTDNKPISSTADLTESENGK